MSVLSPTNLGHSQNFLNNSRLVAALVDRCGIGPDDLVYEIGPGKGIITAQLARRCRQVIAVEKDPILAALLERRFRDQPNVAIRAADCLVDSLPWQPYKVFSNIPFNITSAILNRLVNAANPPDDACLILQKEAAGVYLGRPCETLRSLLLKPWFSTEVIHRFHREDFCPAPSVDVVLLRLRKRGPPLVGKAERQAYRDFVVYSFTAWRPTLRAIFKEVFSWRQLKQISRDCAIDLDATPGSLSFEHLLDLFALYQSSTGPQARKAIAGSERRLLRQQEKIQKVHRTRKGVRKDARKVARKELKSEGRTR